MDTEGRLLDFNPAAQLILPELEKRQVGKEVRELFVQTPKLVAALNQVGLPAEFEKGADGDLQSYEIRTWPLVVPGIAGDSRAVGRAVIFSDVTAQVHLREELRRQSETDPLTGVANRRRFHQALEVECLRYSRGHAPLSLLMIDIDNFKEVNDRYGHPTGDLVLRIVARRLLGCLRKTDLLARYGGEEFSVLLPETRGEGASVIADRIRRAICQFPIDAEGVFIALTVSVGVASHATDREVDAQILLKKADLALYRAKTAGRNRVEVM